MKVISFSQQGPRAICMLSANGIVSNVTLRQPDSSGGTLTYEVCAYRSHYKAYLFSVAYVAEIDTPAYTNIIEFHTWSLFVRVHMSFRF